MPLGRLSFLLVLCTVAAWSPVPVTHVRPKVMMPQRPHAVVNSLILPFHASWYELASARKTLRSDVQGYFSAVDLDGNGVLDKYEFHNAVAQLNGGFPSEVTDRVFDEFDTDGSGDISYNEYVDWMWQRLYAAAVRVEAADEGEGDIYDVLLSSATPGAEMWQRLDAAAARVEAADESDDDMCDVLFGHLCVQLTRAANKELRSRKRAPATEPPPAAPPAFHPIMSAAQATLELLGVLVIWDAGAAMLHFLQYDATGGVDGSAINFDVYNMMAALAGDEPL